MSNPKENAVGKVGYWNPNAERPSQDPLLKAALEIHDYIESQDVIEPGLRKHQLRLREAIDTQAIDTHKDAPTIEDLEAILKSGDRPDIEVQPDGSILAVPRVAAKNAQTGVLTHKYAAAEFY